MSIQTIDEFMDQVQDLKYEAVEAYLLADYDKDKWLELGRARAFTEILQMIGDGYESDMA